MCEKEIIYGGQYGPLTYAGTRQFIDPDERMSYDDLVLTHQVATVRNYVQLRDLAPELPIIPVVQGDTPVQYVRCVHLYFDIAGIDLRQVPLVGVGSICRRQDTDAAGDVFRALHAVGLTRLHAYGLKINGLRKHAQWLVSADSMAWSYGAWKYGERMLRQGKSHGLMPGCMPSPQHKARNCANCLPYALRWRTDAVTAAQQLSTRQMDEATVIPANNDTSSFFGQHAEMDVPRDQWSRYELPDPRTGEKTDGWTRATTFAATLAESYALQIYKQRQVVWGLSRRPDLITLASTISGPEDKKALGAIVDEAHIAAGTQGKANRGTAIHRACQASEQGRHHEVPEELRPHVAGYFEAIRAAGLQLLPEYVERTIIVDRYHVAGTVDNYVRCPDGRIRVLDKKTGNLDYADIEFAVQLALYAHADAVYDYATRRYEAPPEIATDYAIIAHIDPATGKTELQRVNIEWGWLWARTCAEVMDIRKTKHVITPYVPETVATQNVFAPRADYWQSVANESDAADRAAAYDDRWGPAEFTMNSGPMPTPPPAQFVVPSITQSSALAPIPTQPPGPNTYVVPAGVQQINDQFAAFWADDGIDGAPDSTVNGVPLSQYGQPAAWPCSRGEVCVVADTNELHPDSTVCLGSAAQLVPEPTDAELTRQSMSLAERTEVDARVPDDTMTPDDDMVAQIVKSYKDKAAMQGLASRLMQSLGVKETDADGIKLAQYKADLANAIVTLAYQRGVSLADKDGADLGVPRGPGHPKKAGKAPAKKARNTPAEDAAAQEHDSAIRAAVASIRQQTSIEGLTQLHDHYANNTRVGWTPEMQVAARTRAAEIDAATGTETLTPEQMIDGATSMETLSKAYQLATGGGENLGGWTAELDAKAQAKHQQLQQLATSVNA
jgi:hypothetical protein